MLVDRAEKLFDSGSHVSLPPREVSLRPEYERSPGPGPHSRFAGGRRALLDGLLRRRTGRPSRPIRPCTSRRKSEHRAGALALAETRGRSFVPAPPHRRARRRRSSSGRRISASPVFRRRGAQAFLVGRRMVKTRTVDQHARCLRTANAWRSILFGAEHVREADFVFEGRQPDVRERRSGSTCVCSSGFGDHRNARSSTLRPHVTNVDVHERHFADGFGGADVIEMGQREDKLPTSSTSTRRSCCLRGRVAVVASAPGRARARSSRASSTPTRPSSAISGGTSLRLDHQRGRCGSAFHVRERRALSSIVVLTQTERALSRVSQARSTAPLERFTRQAHFAGKAAHAYGYLSRMRATSPFPVRDSDPSARWEHPLHRERTCLELV